MSQKIIFRWSLILAVVIGSIYFLLPTYKYFLYNSDEDFKFLAQEYEDDAIKLGLDLKGGVYIVLELDYLSYFLSLSNPKLNLENKAKLKKLINKSIDQSTSSNSDILYNLEIISKESNVDLGEFYSNLSSSKRNFSNEEIISLIKSNKKQSMKNILDVMRNRIENHNKYGVGEPSIQQLGLDRVVVELAGITDVKKVKEYIQRTAEFKMCLVENKSTFLNLLTKIDDSELSDQKFINSELGNNLLQQGYRSDFSIKVEDIDLVDRILTTAKEKQIIPIQYDIIWDQKDINQQWKDVYLIRSKSVISGGEIKKPQAMISDYGTDQAGKWVVNLDMSKKGKVRWSRFTGNNIGRKVAIILDNKVFMSPTIQSKISSGGTQISGFENKNEAEDISSVLKAGELAAPINILQVNYIGPSLGQDSIDAGSFSLFLGLLIVLIFMIIYYNFSGLVASIALLLNLIFVLAILITMDAVLTLPGMAGLLLTVGMAVDANVIIFERIREELKFGKKVLPAIYSGYDRAFITILDANVTTLLTALILSFMGSGPIQGFATTLGVGIICSMFTAIFITKTIFITVVNQFNIKKLSI